MIADNDVVRRARNVIGRSIRLVGFERSGLTGFEFDNKLISSTFRFNLILENKLSDEFDVSNRRIRPVYHSARLQY